MKRFLSSTTQRRVSVELRQNNNILVKVFECDNPRHNLTVSICRLTFTEFLSLQKTEGVIYNGNYIVTTAIEGDQATVKKFGNSPTWHLKDFVTLTQQEFEKLRSLEVIPTFISVE